MWDHGLTILHYGTNVGDRHHDPPAFFRVSALDPEAFEEAEKGGSKIIELDVGEGHSMEDE